MIGITATQAEMDELLEGGTMEFKKGDLVEVWDHDEPFMNYQRAEYFAHNDHPKAGYPHHVRTYNSNGDIEPAVKLFRYCRFRNARPDLKIDDPVWVRFNDVWKPRHFAGWDADGRMGIWAFGCTSHTTECFERYWFPQGEYRLTPPGSDGPSE